MLAANVTRAEDPAATTEGVAPGNDSSTAPIYTARNTQCQLPLLYEGVEVRGDPDRA